MRFSYTQKRELKSYAQRSVVMAPRGVVASSQPLASMAGCRVLGEGGNAVDAAVATLATLSVVEPHMVGLGGDAFALIYLAETDQMVGLNASGRAPAAATPEWFASRGMDSMPEAGILTVTVPGALMGWAQAVERYGRMDLERLFREAVYYAEEGFPVSEVIAGEWHQAEALLCRPQSAPGPFLPGGRAPRPGQVFRNPDLAGSLRLIAKQGIETFYGGELGRRIADFCRDQGGLLSLEDLAAHRVEWVEPITRDYRGFTVCELPPNGQGVTALEILNILEGYDLAGLGHNSPRHLHLLIEAVKLAFADRDHFISDPQFVSVPVERMLSPEYGRHCRSLIHPDRAMPPPPPGAFPPGSDTVYVATADAEGNAVSFISSLFNPFGSGMVVEGTGIMLQSRGRSFCLDPKRANCLQPGKRPFHTIIPAMLEQEGRFLMAFGVMGADMQPQGQVQFLCNLIDFGMNLQEAMDAPRVFRTQGSEVHFEEGIAPRTINRLLEMGHQLDPTPSPVNKAGGGQAVWRDHQEGCWLAASDRRKDGCAVGY